MIEFYYFSRSNRRTLFFCDSFSYLAYTFRKSMRFQDRMFWNLSHFRNKKVDKTNRRRNGRKRDGYRIISAHSCGYFLNREGLFSSLSSSHPLIYDVIYIHILEHPPKNNLANVKSAASRIASHNLLLKNCKIMIKKLIFSFPQSIFFLKKNSIKIDFNLISQYI